MLCNGKFNFNIFDFVCSSYLYIYIYMHLFANGLTLSTALVMEIMIETGVRNASSRIMGEECGIKNSSS
jgi:hypothetical protein